MSPYCLTLAAIPAANAFWNDAAGVGAAPLKRYPMAPRLRRMPPIGVTALLAAITRLRRRPVRGGGPKPPPQEPRREAHWDDPALWALLVH
jgi:hypothetical protein